MIRDSNPGGCQGYFSPRKRPDRLWCRTSLPFSRFWGSYLEVKRPDRNVDHYLNLVSRLRMYGVVFFPQYASMGLIQAILQGEHKVFPWLQTFITRKLRGIHTYFFFSKCNSTQEVFFATH